MMLKRRALVKVGLFALLVVTFTWGTAQAKKAVPGAASASWLADRQLDYLLVATATFSPGDPVNVLAHLQRGRLQSNYHLPPHSVPAGAWSAALDKMAALEDTRDFDALSLLHVLLRFSHDPLLEQGLVDAVESALLDFKYWYVEPTPLGLSDQSWYWSENHVAIFHTIELLMGQAYPNRVFGNDGRIGAAHVASVRPRLLTWLEHRLRFGFSEWHSDVYYAKDVIALSALIDYASDAEIQTLAAAVLDTLLFDLALHAHRSTFGASHGRSYKKDKMDGQDQPTWNIAKLLFDGADYPYRTGLDQGATLFAMSERYDLPQAILQVAATTTVFVDRERMGIPVPEVGPPLPGPVAPYGLSYSDPEALSVWWAAGAFAPWPVVPLTISALDTYGLWDNHFFAPIAGLRSIAGNLPYAQQLAAAYWPMLDLGLLPQVNTTTWRSPEVTLSAALDGRKGAGSAQSHSWQATLDARAIVFTNHPFHPPVASTTWGDDIETGGYWTGEATSPRSAQYRNVGVHIYAPLYPAHSPAPFDAFVWEPYTHAYFPQDRFDEVVQQGAWTVGRLGNGYVALYSYRPASFVTYDPAVYATRGMVKPFDLIATGGADNVWIVECGRAAEWGSFQAFTAAIAASAITITPRGPAGPGGTSSGYDVSYQSPSQGPVTWGWTAPFVVAGQVVPTAQFLRYDNPFSTTAFDSPTIDIAAGGFGVSIDIAGRHRTLTGP